MKVCSFDIFDTCLIRACGSPIQLWEILGFRLLGMQASHSLVKDFVLARRYAEGEARQLLVGNQQEDVVLENIYQHFDFFRWGAFFTKEEAIKAEMMVEKDMLIPVDSIVKAINKARNEGNKILFISDMYLPTLFIQEILEKKGIYKSGDQVFVSGDIGFSKQSGNLYRHIADLLKLSFKDWKHFGDNAISDYKIPRQLGIHASLLQHQLSFYEKKIINNSTASVSTDLQLLANISKSIRLHHESDNAPRLLFATDFIAPIITSFVHAILDDAHQRGIHHLFFMARDGYLPYLVSKELISAYPGITIDYLYASRRSLYFPGIDTLDYKSIKAIIPDLKGCTYQQIAYVLQMEDFPFATADIHNKDGEQILRDLLSDFTFVTELTRRHAQQSELCYEYLHQMGIDQEGCAIVDMIGSRKCQLYLNQILRRHQKPVAFAYYFEVTPYRSTNSDSYKALFFQEELENNPYYHHISQPLLEQYFGVTPQLRTIAYQKDNDCIIPIFEEDQLSSDLKSRLSALHQQVCCLYAHYYKLIGINNPESCCAAYYTAFTHFCHIPRYDYLMAFTGFFSTSSKSETEPILWKQSVIGILNNKAFVRWKEGNVIYNAPSLLRTLLTFLLKLFLNYKAKSTND